MEVTNILGERIEPKWKPPRAVQLGELWADVDGDDMVARGLGRLPSWAQEPGIRSDIEQRLHEARDALRTAEARARTAALPSSGADESPSWRQSGRSAAPEAAPAAASPEVVPAAREVTFSGTLNASPVPA